MSRRSNVEFAAWAIWAFIVSYPCEGAFAQGIVPEYGLEGTSQLTSIPNEALTEISEPDTKDSWLSACSVGVRTWISWGQADRNHAGTSFRGFTDPISDLRWREMVSETVEFSASALLLDKVIVNAEAGVGGISGGNFRDQDFSITGRRGLFSESSSPINNDDLQYFNFDLGWRFYEDTHFIFDGLIGYQYWREKYLAEGGSQVVPPFGGALPPGPGITEQFTWQGFRIGGQCILAVSPSCSLKSRAMFMPITHFENEDIHHNRADFLQNPSGFDRAEGGFGVMADIRICYSLWKGLSLDLGYRVWDATSGEGETLIRTTSGERRLPFNEGNTTREGLILGLNYQF